jgi:CheY-like chemotaxis protein
MNKRTTVSILLVEDDPAHLLLARKAIERANSGPNGKQLVVHVARDGEEALVMLLQGQEHIDLILLDLRLPKRDGLEVLEIIKQDNRLKVIPVVVLTTSEDERDIAAAHRAHVSAYMVKPFSQTKMNELMMKFRSFWTSENVRLASV